MFALWFRNWLLYAFITIGNIYPVTTRRRADTGCFLLLVARILIQRTQTSVNFCPWDGQ